jgi:RimJ/RimL family protein N-acetyltransferase
MTDLTNFTARPKPDSTVLIGRTVRVEPLDFDRHGDDLAAAIVGPENAALWDYIPIGPFADLATLRATFEFVVANRDWGPMAIVRPPDNKTLGTASYMRMRPEHGSAEVGCIVFGEELQRTIEATETMFLMAQHVFDDLGYRRYEWKCDNSNAASKRAAERFGFTFEGVFRNDMVMKGRNRDTAWFSITDTEWPEVKASYERWLSPDNFDDQGWQLKALKDC